MRLKRSRLKTCFHRPAVPQKDGEGNSYVEYGPTSEFRAEEWPAGGKLQSERYGQRLPNIRNMRFQERYAEVRGESGEAGFQIENGPMIRAGDGICLYVPEDSEPDYRIVAVFPYRFLTLEVERI